MSLHTYEDNCPGCRPVLIDPVTMKRRPDDDPAMQIVLAVWEHQTTPAQRKAWHAVTCNNSRDARDIELAGRINSKIVAALHVQGPC